jgi:hypothetical protein
MPQRWPQICSESLSGLPRFADPRAPAAARRRTQEPENKVAARLGSSSISLTHGGTQPSRPPADDARQTSRLEAMQLRGPDGADRPLRRLSHSLRVMLRFGFTLDAAEQVAGSDGSSYQPRVAEGGRASSPASRLLGRANHDRDVAACLHYARADSARVRGRTARRGPVSATSSCGVTW